MKIIVWILILTVALCGLFGCCTRTDSKGITTKSFLNCTTTAQDMVCNPPPAVMSAVNAAAPFLATVINTLIPGSEAFISAQNAVNAVNSIKNVGCISMIELNSLITYLDGLLAVKKVAATKRGALVYQAPFSTDALKDWAGKK